MADERLLAPIRRFFADKDAVMSAYQAIFEAYSARLSKVTVIVQKSNEGESASGQVVVNGEDYLRWMEALEARLKEIEAEAGGEGPLLEGTEHVDFSRRYVRS